MRISATTSAVALAGFALVACSGSQSTQASPSPGTTAVSGIAPNGDRVALTIVGDKIGSVGIVPTARGCLWPPVVDSHVHLALLPVGADLAKHGVLAAVDLAAPERALAAPAPITLIQSGPMITRPDGYPLDSWGADGYGIGCADDACITSTIDRLAAEGAKVIKLPLDGNGLPADRAKTAAAYAHKKNLRVAVHALTDASALVGAQIGADILAHTPTEPLTDATIAAWKGRAVISTLAAFGGREATVKNLAKLRAAGVTVLYGTDLGNTDVPGPNEREMDLLRQAGLDDTAITDAMTTTPIKYWSLSIGALTKDSEATFVLLAGDPRTDAKVLLKPVSVFQRGRELTK